MDDAKLKELEDRHQIVVKFEDTYKVIFAGKRRNDVGLTHEEILASPRAITVINEYLINKAA